MIKLLAPAKINLTLEALGKRPDGYHEIRSVIQTIGLCDELRFTSSPNIEIKSDMPAWVPEESLVSKTVKLLQESAGSSRAVKIEIKKRIPLVSGLGGDSSDAAATLHGLNKLWKLGLSQKKLHALAAQLGSDVPFFLYGGTALAEGRGEKLTPLPPLPRVWVVLVVPSVPRLPGKTKQLYASLKPADFTDGNITEKLVAALKEGKKIGSSSLFNTFENVAFARFPEIDVYRQRTLKLGADNIHLAGSGPTLFTVSDNEARAQSLYTQLKKQRLEACLTDTLPCP
ncbi:MAG: 4-(cytidine 5'-diphospho)-2-C-methyl-D-erythritol kinase [Chloroflexi bacterium]|nr:4-(cytidine 5'-diphospho)-2-C-methyl-D-erythritol kinase [Chloroflexota bacterium]